MANYTYSQYLSSPSSIVADDTVTLDDGCVLVYTGIKNFLWGIQNLSTITTDKSVFNGLIIFLEILNSISKCELTIEFVDNINSQNELYTIATAYLLKDGNSSFVYKDSFYYTYSREIILEQFDSFTYYLQEELRLEACFKTQTTCCLEALCDPDNYVLI